MSAGMSCALEGEGGRCLIARAVAVGAGVIVEPGVSGFNVLVNRVVPDEESLK